MIEVHGVYAIVARKQRNVFSTRLTLSFNFNPYIKKSWARDSDDSHALNPRVFPFLADEGWQTTPLHPETCGQRRETCERSVSEYWHSKGG